MRRAQWGLAALLVVLGLAAHAQYQPAAKGPPEFKGDLAKRAKQKKKVIQEVLDALGPAMAEQLRGGKQVEIDGVGTFRVVKVGEYRDLVNGLPTTIPARNYVEFIPAPALNTAANGAGAIPSRTVEGYEFRVNPNSNPGIRTPDTKVPRSRGNRER
jgi:nucleoid DNA-binding protein